MPIRRRRGRSDYIYPIFISFTLYHPPDILSATPGNPPGGDANLLNKLTLPGIRGALLITAEISIFIFLANFLSKFAVSAFHLMRDARERYQLTRVYLALNKEGAMSSDDRQILLSSIFSRADTGLLKHDGTPELPISAIISALKGKG